MWTSRAQCKGLAQREIPEHSDVAIHPLQSAQMPCCPRRLRELRQGKDAGKAEEAQTGADMTEGCVGVHHE